MSLLRNPNEVNPYPTDQVLLFWHDFWKQMVEDHGYDWREQTRWANANIPEFKTFNTERYQKPWLAIRAAYEAKCVELEAALNKLKELQQDVVSAR